MEDFKNEVGCRKANFSSMTGHLALVSFVTLIKTNSELVTALAKILNFGEME